MVSVVKSEWHQVEKRYGIEIDADMLTEIYPELDEGEIEAKLADLESGEEDVETIFTDALENSVDIDWDYLDEDDWWTDRKGGYEVTYQVKDQEVDQVSPVTAIETVPVDILPNYPAGEYTIRVWGRTREIGVGKISKQQYDYWSHEDHEDDLSDAMNESYDYEENNTPKKAQFDSAYYEYQGVHSFWGFDEGDTHMTITNESGEEIYDGTLDGFINEAHGDNDTVYDATEEVEELYPEYLGKGYFVMWTQGGKGSCIQTTIDTAGEEFDPRKLKYTTWDVQGSSIVNRLIYNGGELDDYGMDSEHDNWRGQWSQFDVYHNKK